jgi:uncharacterized zinc-type alcohol dehydrogenase-like protein
MPTKVNAYAASAVNQPLAATTVERRDPREDDVVIDILFAGICHSDIHQVKDEWGNGTFPMVPGHEIVGTVSKIGAKVTKFKVGDTVGVGCMVDSCRECGECKDHHEQFCVKGNSGTYNSTEQDKTTKTYGGYSKQVVVRDSFVLAIPKNLDPAGAAPLLCAGITTYSPLKTWGVKKGDRVGVVGLGGLGHMAVKLAASMGAHVTVFSTSQAKEADAKRLGAESFVVSKDPANFAKIQGSFDFIIDSVSAEHDYNLYLGLLRPRGVMVLVGAPPTPSALHAFALIPGAKKLAGSMIGGIKETQEMLDYCGEHNIVSDIETIPMSKVNEAYERTLKGDVRYRFVIDIATLAN